jgi:dTDP-4-amino-4,6-dideoxygalactose transaminase
MPDQYIPLNRPLLAGKGLDYIRAAFAAGHTSGDGHFTRQCQSYLERHLNGGRALLTSSCTDALELSALLLNLQAGDEVTVPSFTFVSTANAFALRGARPVFVDIRPDTLNLDDSLLASAITPRTRAIVVMHYGGVACEMNAIGPIAASRGIPIVEDAAHGLFGSYEGKPLGAFGSLGVFSFHESKNFTCGEGGAIIVNDSRLMERAEILREKGTNRSRFFRGEIDKYTWIDIGSSFLPADVLAALLWAQFEMREQIQSRRQVIHARYAAELSPWAARAGVQLPAIPSGCQSAYHLFWMLLPSPAVQAALIAHLRARRIHAVFHYQPLHLTPMGRQLGGAPGQCPVAESAAERIVRLPFHFDLSSAEQSRVIEAVQSFSP